MVKITLSEGNMVTILSRMDKTLEMCVAEGLTMLQTVFQSSQDESTYDSWYEVVKTHKDYEERHYSSAVFVCTVVTNVYQEAAKTEAFRTLQNYAMGQNEDGAYLSLKPPILTQVVCDSNVSFERKFVVCAYLSNDVTDIFPKPNNQNVFIKNLPDMTVFVKTFQGITSDERWTTETRNFTETIKHRESVRTNFYITATYDSPFHLVSNRNEIWLVKYSNESYKALASPDSETQFVQIGSKKMEVHSAVSWLLYAVISYISMVLFMLKSVTNSGIYVRNNWTSIKRNGRTSLKQLWGIFTWENFNLMSSLGIGATKFATKFSFGLLSVILDSAGISSKTPT